MTRSSKARRRVPLRTETDLDHGGRWTSWLAGGREWLWVNPRVEGSTRNAVQPGDDFVDAGGAEECFPTVRGRPDHGDVWSRSWSGSPNNATVGVPGVATLFRQVREGPELMIGYRIEGAEGTPFIHAVHALLAVSQSATLDLPGARTAILLDEPNPDRTWPSGLDDLGPDDGTAVCALVPETRHAVITDGADRLELFWDCPARPELCSLLLWRNLGGWPPEDPYRSIGIEPMVGRSATLESADPGMLAVIGPGGIFEWNLRVVATTSL